LELAQRRNEKALWSTVCALLVAVLLAGCAQQSSTPSVAGKATPGKISSPEDEARALAARGACYQKLTAIETELVGHVLSLESGSRCTTNDECVVVPVETSCLSSCPNVIARKDGAELKKRLAASESKWCGERVECTMQSLCARTTAVCERGRCRAKWEGVTPSGPTAPK
jgi:hypothetical protein